MASLPRCSIAGPSIWKPSMLNISRSRHLTTPPSRPSSQSRSLFTTPLLHSGHNRWSKIRHRKAETDSVRSNLFGRLTRDITAAIRAGGPFPEKNTRLAIVLKKAKQANFPKDRLENTFAKADKSGDNFTSVTYELVGPLSSSSVDGTAGETAGPAIALVMECSTDSPARTHTKMREMLSKAGGSSYRISSVGHLFEKRGVIRLAPKDGRNSFDEVFELALEKGAEEVREVEAENEEEGKIVQNGGIIIEILCEPSAINPISSQLNSHNILEAEQRTLSIGPPIRIKDEASIEDEQDQPQASSSSSSSSSMPPVEEEEEAGGWVNEEVISKLDRLVEMLENEADVTRVWSNLRGWP